MKTLQELYSEITANDELKKAFAEAAKDNKIVEFAKEHGVETSVDEIKTFLEAQAKNEKELSPDDLETAAGGKRIRPGASYHERIKHCHGDVNGPLHQWVKTGHEERWLFWAWTRGYDLFTCTLCGETKEERV